MAIHSKKDEHLRRRRESLGHMKIHLDDLESLVDEWERWGMTINISVGDGVTADFVEDLVDATKSEISHLTIQTENPVMSIALRRHKAELSYISGAQEMMSVNNLRASLKPYRLHTPYYRLRSFWWVVYLLITITTVLVVAKIDNWDLPVWPSYPPIGALVFLIFWFLYSFGKMRNRSSTRILRGKKVSRKWMKAKNLTYWIFPPVALILGLILGRYLGKH